MTSHPARRAPSAAAIPLGPPPTTRTSHLAKSGMARGLSSEEEAIENKIKMFIAGFLTLVICFL
jgi:hypothetical protein